MEERGDHPVESVTPNFYRLVCRVPPEFARQWERWDWNWSIVGVRHRAEIEITCSQPSKPPVQWLRRDGGAPSLCVVPDAGWSDGDP